MLKIWLADEVEGLNMKPDKYFDVARVPVWFDDELVKAMIKDVDKTDVVSYNMMIGPIGPIPPERLSSGVKTLIMIYKNDSQIWNASKCGDNCAKWLVEISKRKDIVIWLGHFMIFPVDMQVDGIFLSTGATFTNFREYKKALLEATNDWDT